MLVRLELWLLKLLLGRFLKQNWSPDEETSLQARAGGTYIRIFCKSKVRLAKR
jgi:hypothetical protein